MDILGFWLVGCGELFSYDDAGGDLHARPVDPIEEQEADEEPDAAAEEEDPDPSGPVDADGDGIGAARDCDDDDERIHPGADDYCGDEVDADCDGEDCVSWEDGFETGTIDRPWRLPGPVDWSARRVEAFSGMFSAASGNIADDDTSELTVDVDTPLGGLLSFWHSGSTEENFDELQLTIDGDLVSAWSGEWDWQQSSFPLAPGVHDLSWTFFKDASLSGGDDIVRLDDVRVDGAR